MLSRRLASTVTGGQTSARKIVLVGAGFLGSYIAKALVADPRNRVVLVSRHPQSLHSTLSPLGSQILAPVPADITKPLPNAPLEEALEGAHAVVSMVGVLAGNERMMVEVQEKGAEKVATVAKEKGVGRCVMISAIGSSEFGVTPYQRTKYAGEQAFLSADPQSTIIRPSIVFGPGDSFFTRFATLAKWLPFLPVFGGGVVRFQPVYAGDVARLVEICCRDDPEVVKQVGGRVIEAGGPDGTFIYSFQRTMTASTIPAKTSGADCSKNRDAVFTYRDIMRLTLRYSRLEGRRMIISLPYWVGMIQGWLLEKLPESIFTVTRDQIRQLRNDNIVSTSDHPPLHSADFKRLLTAFPSSLPSSAPPNDAGLTSVHQSLPKYLTPKGELESGKRTHGRAAPGSARDIKGMDRRD